MLTDTPCLLPCAPFAPPYQAKEHQEQLAEARLRFVAAVKANYQDNFRKGWLSDSGLRVLMVSERVGGLFC